MRGLDITHQSSRRARNGARNIHSQTGIRAKLTILKLTQTYLHDAESKITGSTNGKVRVDKSVDLSIGSRLTFDRFSMICGYNERPTDRQTDKQIDRHTDAQANRHSDRQTDRHRQTDRQTERQTDGQRQTG